jgi:hypothetical protein
VAQLSDAGAVERDVGLDAVEGADVHAGNISEIPWFLTGLGFEYLHDA